MPDMVYQAPVVGAGGDIAVHGRSALLIPIGRQNDAGTDQDISGQTLVFEIAGQLATTLRPDGEDPLTQWIDISETSIGALPLGLGLPFALIDAGAVRPQVLWAGKIRAYGFEGAPPASTVGGGSAAYGVSAGRVVLINGPVNEKGIVRNVGQPGRDGPSSAGLISFDDSAAQLGVSNVQDAILTLLALVLAGGGAGDGGTLDFSEANNSGQLPGL